MTRIEIIGFVIELMILGVAVYLYLYTSGILSSKDHSKRKRQDQFIAQYGRWMRPLSLVLMAIMTVNIVLRFL